jgi:hypothetical protein
MGTHTTRLIAIVAVLGLTAAAISQDSPARKEIQRNDLTGAPGMEVINSISELKPGDTLALHIHHGIEAGIVLQGGMVQAPGRDPMPLPTGTVIMNLRDVAHGGWKVIGETAIRLFTVHIVDKGKPLYDSVR